MKTRMKTRKSIILILAGICFLSSSCSDWLTIEPKTQTTGEKLFTTVQGYSDALAGLYISMRGNYSPVSFFVGDGTDQLANLYYISPSSLNAALPNFDFTNTYADAGIGSMFLQQYKTIANANLLIDALQTQTQLDAKLAKMIEGEALAVRAYMHFDLIRLFGPMPNHIGSKRYLPYVTKVSTEPYTYLAYEDYMKLLQADLDKSEQLLKESDPILNYTNDQLNNSIYNSIEGITDPIWYYRQNRFNYYAILGLQARVSLWLGNNDKAYTYAKKVIEATNSDGSTKFRLGTVSDISAPYYDYTLFSEHLMGEAVENFDDASAFTGRYATNVTDRNKILYNLYESKTDMRTTMFTSVYSYSTGSYAYGTLKYHGMKSTDVSSLSARSIPLIRLSEMYLIMVETAPIQEANTYFSTFRSARNAEPLELTKANRESTLVTEYTKEFWSEGQCFFAYKRLGLAMLPMSLVSMGESKYILPLPTAETGSYN